MRVSPLSYTQVNEISIPLEARSPERVPAVGCLISQDQAEHIYMRFSPFFCDYLVFVFKGPVWGRGHWRTQGKATVPRSETMWEAELRAMTVSGCRVQVVFCISAVGRREGEA